MQPLPHLSKPQATVLAVELRDGAGPLVCPDRGQYLLAKGLKRKEQTVRQQLREWYYDPTEAGRQRQALHVGPLSRLAGLGRQLVAGHATGARHRCHSVGGTVRGVAVSVVYRGCAIRVASVVLPANTKHAWRPEWLRLCAGCGQPSPAAGP